MNFSSKLALAFVSFIQYFRTVSIRFLVDLLFRKKTEIKKILINRDGAFGDSIVALPALSIVRQNYPQAQIDLLSVNNHGISFKEISIEKGLISKLYNIKKSQRKATLKKLRNQQYDLFIQLPQNLGLYKSIRNILLVRYYLKINYAFGWDSGRIKSFMRQQKKHIKIPTNTGRFVEMLKQNGLSGEVNYPITSKAPINIEIKELLQSMPPITFLIGGKLKPKKWPLNHWVSLAKLIGEKQKILIVGGDEEKPDGEYIVGKAANTINLCGALKIPELRYILEKSKIAISLDTGAMHLCDSTKTKLIVLFSTRDLSNRWFPTNENAVVIEKVLPCSFCLKTECSDNICMSNILPNEVYSEIKPYL